jgi:hypothetical protein
MMEGMDLIQIYCKHIHKCHNVSPVQLDANKNIYTAQVVFSSLILIFIIKKLETRERG